MYFAVMNRRGQIRVYNYTIIETLHQFYKYARENYGLKSKNDSRSIEELRETSAG